MTEKTLLSAGIRAVWASELAVVYLDLGSARTGKFCVWDAQSEAVVMYP